MKSPRPESIPAAPPREWLSRLAIVTFGVALAVRLIHVWQIHRAPFFALLIGDAHGYDEWASRLAAGDWVGHDVFYQAPLYPYFLGVIYAVAGHSLVIVRLCQAVVGAAACALLALAVRRLFTDREGMIAGLALALYAPAIFLDSLIQKSVLDVLFTCWILWIAAGILEHPENRRSWLWLGVVTGGLALTRENALVFVVLIVAWAFAGPWRTVHVLPPGVSGRKVPTTRTFTGSGVRRAAPFLLGLAFVLLPVAIRNYAVAGGFYLTTSQFGPNFFIGNNAQADGLYRALRPGRGAPEFERQDATELAEQASGHSLTPAEVSTYWTDRALEFITSQPGAWLKLLGRKVVLLVNAVEMIDTESQETYAEWSWPVWLGGWFGHFGVLVPLALFGAWVLWPDRRRLSVFYAMVAAYSVSLLLFYVFARYRYPLVPLLVLFASAGVAAVPRFVRAASPGQKAGAAAALLIAVVATNWPIVPAGFPQAVMENNLGMALQAEGRLDEAMLHFQRAIAFRDDFTPAYNNIGLVQRAKGQPDEAIKAFERAIAARPNYPDSYFNLGFELQSRGEHQKAIDRFREFIRLNQDAANAIPANNLIAFSLLAQGRLDEAAAGYRLSLGRDPGNVDALSGLADTLLRQGRFDDAAVTYREYVRRVPGSAKGFHNLGLALVRQGKERDAVDAFAQSVALEPANAAFHEDLGNALGSVGRLDDAVVSYRRAVTLAPTNVKMRNSLGLALAAQGKMPEALAEFQRSLELEPDNIQTRRDLETARRIRP